MRTVLFVAFTTAVTAALVMRTAPAAGADADAEETRGPVTIRVIGESLTVVETMTFLHVDHNFGESSGVLYDRAAGRGREPGGETLESTHHSRPVAAGIGPRQLWADWRLPEWDTNLRCVVGSDRKRTHFWVSVCEDQEMTLLDEGWRPVTPIGSQGEYTWRLWCDARRPVEADLMGWPDDGDFLATFIEASDGGGKSMCGGIGGRMREPDERVGFFHSRQDGFPSFVGVRFVEDVDDVVIETTARHIAIEAGPLETHYGMKFFVTPLDEGEKLVAVTGGGTRQAHHSVDWLPEEPKTGYFPFPSNPS